MSIRRNAIYVIGGLFAFVAASALMAVLNTVVNALIPQKKPDPPGVLHETLEEKGKRLAAEEAARNKTEKKDSGEAQVETPKESTGSESVVVDREEPVVVSTPAPPPAPPAPAPALGPGNMGYEPQYLPPPAPGGPGNLN